LQHDVVGADENKLSCQITTLPKEWGKMKINFRAEQVLFIRKQERLKKHLQNLKSCGIILDSKNINGVKKSGFCPLFCLRNFKKVGVLWHLKAETE